MGAPARKESFDTIKTSHDLNGNSKKLSAYYAGWAQKYDDDVANEKYRGPAIMADLASFVAMGYLHRSVDKIVSLDAGCGTGLAGVEMKKRGFAIVDGFDLSKEMTDCAAETGAFRDLKSDVDLNVDQPNVFARNYDLLVCCGVLTLGHVEPEAMRRLAEYLRPGGIMIVSTRNSYLEDGAFAKAHARLQEEGHYREIACMPNAWYIAEEGAHYWICQRPA